MPQATDTLEAQADIHNLMSELKRANGGATRHTRTTNTAVATCRQTDTAGRQTESRDLTTRWCCFVCCVELVDLPDPIAGGVSPIDTVFNSAEWYDNQPRLITTTARCDQA